MYSTESLFTEGVHSELLILSRRADCTQVTFKPWIKSGQFRLLPTLEKFLKPLPYN
jgi:hypothetical protein